MMRSAQRLLVAALPAALSVPPAAMPQTPARATEHSAEAAIQLNVGEGRLVRLNRDATNVFIADSTVADVQIASPRTVYVYGRRVGQTTLTAVGAGDQPAGSITLRVSRSAEAVAAALARGGAPLNLRFAGDRLVLSGPVGGIGAAMEADSTAKAYNPANLPPLDLTRLAGTQQITLRVRIAEVSRNDLNRLGVNLSVLARPGSFTLNLLTNGLLGNSTGLVNTGESAFNGSVGFSNNRVNATALIDALQREGIVTTLAEPNLTTLSGETASFLAGGEIPIPVPQAFNVTTLEYKTFGVSLAFTPTLLPGNRIAMRVRPEVSEISNVSAVTINGYTAPSFTTRRAETNVELASGQTVAIAGLFQRSLNDSIDRVPFLGDVPILGALFRSQRFQRAETELIIMVTPYLTSPVGSPDQIPVPTDDAARTRPRQGSVVGAGFKVD